MARKKEIEQVFLNKTELQQLSKCAIDPFFFSSFIYVVHPKRGKVKFQLYPYQMSVLYNFLINRFNIILKFRQAGITELIAMYCLWLAMFHPDKKINIISIKDSTAKKVLKKIKYMYKNLPPHLRTKIVNGRANEYGTVTEMEFSNGSFIASIPTTEEAGRSEGLSLLVIDEAAIIRWASTIWASSFPTLSTGGAAILNSCVTGDTEIVGENGNFRVEQVCPKEFGAQDIRFMNLKVLTHKLQWRKVLYGLNKGVLETWEIKNEHGDIIKCTPAHKFLTPKGWKSAKDCIDSNIPIIRYDTGFNKLEENPVTIPPVEEIFKPVRGYPNYLISNLGKVYHKDKMVEKEARPNPAGYLRIKLWNKGRNKNFMVAKLVAEHFIGNIPNGYVVDHINNVPTDNYVTNLQIITIKENANRAVRFSRGLNLNYNTGKGASDIELVGYIKYLGMKGRKPDFIIQKVLKKFGKIINRSYISRVLNERRNKNIELSYLTVIRKYSDNIYDITIEGDESYISTNSYVSHNTPYGVGNFYHSEWVNAVAGGKASVFHPIRLRWDMHPERDQLWYDQMSIALGPRRTAQEIDGDFLTSGNNVFDPVDIKAIEDYLDEYTVIERKFHGQYLRYSDYDPSLNYFIGADVATGRAKDYSAFTCIDQWGEEHSVFKGKVPVDKYAKILGDEGKKFGYALLAPETNDIGLAVTTTLQTEGYPNLYYSRNLLEKKKKKGQKRKKREDRLGIADTPGWLTSSANRSVIVEELEEDVRKDNITCKDPFFCQEAYTFIYDSNNRPVALGKSTKKTSADSALDEDFSYTDDSILGKAIANHIRKGKHHNTVVAPQ